MVRDYGPHKTLYNRWKGWSQKGIFAQIMAGLAMEHREEKTGMIDATYLKAYRTATSLAAKRGKRGRLVGRAKGGMNTKLHAICDSQVRPLNLFVTACQVSDYIGEQVLLGSLPDVDWLLWDRGYDADWFRDASTDQGIRTSVPGRKQRMTTVSCDKRRRNWRNRVEIMFGKVKDWLQVATRYDRCPTVFLSAISRATIVIYWLW